MPKVNAKKRWSTYIVDSRGQIPNALKLLIGTSKCNLKLPI
jgi:hypothetical protein